MSRQNLVEVSKELFDEFYNDHFEFQLNRTPKWRIKDSSVAWYYRDKNVIACVRMECYDGDIKWFVNKR